MNDFAYGFSKELNDTDFGDARERVENALKDEGFGVLTSIDVKKTLKEKLDVDFKPYTIIGACNPSFAHKALQTEEQIGLLLPCNVVIQEKETGKVVVSIADPRAMFKLVDTPELQPLADEVATMLRRVMKSI